MSANPEKFGVRRGWVLLVLGLPLVLAVLCVIHVKFHWFGDVQTQTIDDVTKPQTLVFHARGAPHAMELRVYGEVAGKGTLTVTDRGVRPVAGKVKLEEAGDYYDKAMTVEYKPDGAVTGGWLVVRVKFEN